MGLAVQMAGGVPSRETQLINYAKSCVKPGYEYFKNKFGAGGDLEVAVSAFKLARHFDPVKIAELKPTASEMDQLKMFPSSAISSLKSELPQYLAISADLSPGFDRVDWWKRHEQDLPNWSNQMLARCCRFYNRHYQQQSVYFLFFRTVLMIDKHLHYRTTQKHLSCFNISTRHNY